MSRTERLLSLMQVLRRHRYPVTGAQLATELGTSVRTVYRDIVTLQGQGARIDGERGLGYLLRPGYQLPPLMFSEEELEALVLGSRWIAGQSDPRLAHAAREAMSKIGAVLTPELRAQLDTNALLVGPRGDAPGAVDLGLLRQAIRSERKLLIDYGDADDVASRRTIWPFALAYFERVRVLVAWCELREAFRHFRCDRIRAAELAELRYPRRRQALLKEWRALEGVGEQ